MANTPITSVEVIGSGCAKCKKLHELTKSAATELGLNTEIIYTTDIEKIVAMGVMSSPVLAVNGKPVLVGSVPDIQTIKNLLSEHAEQKIGQGGGCTCGSC